MIRFQCPGCAAEFNTPDDKAGKSAKCPQCEAMFLIPQVEEPTPSSETPAPQESFEVVAEEQVEVEPCPGCGARLAVASEHADKNVDCPYCAATFHARPIHPTPSETERPTSRLRREEDDDSLDDRSERRMRRRSVVRRRSRRDEKPGNVTAVGVMLLTGGIYGLLYTAGVLLGSMFLCCLWPFMYLSAVWSIFAIIRGSAILGNNDDQPAPTTLLVLQILAIFNGDLINCILGIVGFVMISDERARAWFDGRRPDE